MIHYVNKDAIYNGPQDIYHGSSDDRSFHYMYEGKAFYESMPESRKNMNFLSVIGGLCSLNWLSFLKPPKITFFDINKYAVCHAEIVVRLWIESSDSSSMLSRLRSGNYSVRNADEELTRQHFVDNKVRFRWPLEETWRVALHKYDDVRSVLSSSHLKFRRLNIIKKSFRIPKNTWAYFSNVFESTPNHFRMNIRHTHNVVLFYISLPLEKGSMTILDLHDTDVFAFNHSSKSLFSKSKSKIQIPTGRVTVKEFI